MAIDKDERATDTKSKTGITNFLGSMVLAGIPLLASGIFGAWLTISSNTNSIEQLERDATTQQRHIDSLIAWRLEAANERFKTADADRLQNKLDKLSDRMQAIEVSERGLSEAVRRNTDLILDHQNKIHTHSYGVGAGK